MEKKGWIHMTFEISLKYSRTMVVVLAVLFIVPFTAGFVNQKDKKGTDMKKEDNKKIVSKEIDYKAGDVTLKGYLFYDENKSQKSPGIIVVHEWWGNNDYSRMRAKMLSELGYVALAADMYGNGATFDNPQDAQKNAGLIYSNFKLLKERMEAALNALINTGLVDSKRVAAIGYCFGGTVVLNAANLGLPLKAVVSFHGGLRGFKASSQIRNTYVLVCNGGADKSVTLEDIANFKKSMNEVGAHYEFKTYEGATHAFTNPASTEVGKKFNMPIAYNAQADSASWKDMEIFFSKYFPAN
jgi:dienelactone hydrolase